MSTRVLMSVTASLLGLAGVVLQFAPQELASALSMPSRGLVPVVCQLLGGSLLGLACLDWFSRGARLGGIYGRPLVLANLVHFATAGLALGRHAVDAPTPLIAGVAAVYVVLALSFARVSAAKPAAGR